MGASGVRRLACAAAMVLLGAAACRSVPADPFEAGEAARGCGDLPAALLAYDRVAVQHPRYPEARSAAVAVERRLRRSHQHMLEGIRLRSEWREPEALAEFERAREVWPGQPGLWELIEATRSRMEVFGSSGGRSEAPADGSQGVIATGPVHGAAMVPPHGNGASSPALARTDPAPVAPTVLPPGEAPMVAAPPGQALAGRLAALEDQLQRGQVETALGELELLLARWPEDPRLRSRVARLLHQRGLLRYGQGAVAAAMDDWRRAQELNPEWLEVTSVLEQVRAETRGR